jgi:sulfonate transport system substrate-binding protein
VNRRNFLLLASSSLTTALVGPAISAEPLKELRIGYQKIGALLIVKEEKVLEQRFEPQGVRVRWIEFAFGPPLLEALGAEAIDYGYTGDSPPIFAQAARANLLYAGAIPARGYGRLSSFPLLRPSRRSPAWRARRSPSPKRRAPTTCWSLRSKASSFPGAP